MVDTIQVLAGMYRINTYTDIKTPTFRTSLNTDRTGHVPTIPADFEQYRLISSLLASIEIIIIIFFLVL